MLREIEDVKQEQGGGRRRWFESDDLDVIVWMDRRGSVTGFQLCYDTGDGDHALTWREGTGFAHSRIDLGDDNPPFDRAPVLLPDGRVPWSKIVRLFDARSRTLDVGLRRLIRDRLGDHGANTTRS